LLFLLNILKFQIKQKYNVNLPFTKNAGISSNPGEDFPLTVFITFSTSFSVTGEV
jgi:hypothetical protein